MEAGKINNRRTEWFENARFGLFIHWGIIRLLWIKVSRNGS